MTGICRDAQCDTSLALFFNRVPTDEEMRAVHEIIGGWLKRFTPAASAPEPCEGWTVEYELDGSWKRHALAQIWQTKADARLQLDDLMHKHRTTTFRLAPASPPPPPVDIGADVAPSMPIAPADDIRFRIAPYLQEAHQCLQLAKNGDGFQIAAAIYKVEEAVRMISEPRRASDKVLPHV